MGNELYREPKASEHFCALAFKIMTDPYVGRLTFFRVYSGQISTGDSILNPNADKKERVGRNPKTKVETKISSRKVVTFKPSSIVKNKLNQL